MKINILMILKKHLLTLHNNDNGKYSKFDFFIFYIIPLIASTSSYFLKINIEFKDYINIVTFFGIFIALCINIQVSIYGIYIKTYNVNNEKKSNKNQIKILLIREINTNISYLNIIGCSIVFIAIILYFFKLDGMLITSIFIYLFLNFLLTLLMVIKRSFILFDKEYE